MNGAIVCKLSPVKTLAISAAPLRELLNFLIYEQHAELLTERARRQPALSLAKIPSTPKELREILKVERLGKNGKLFFDCTDGEHQVAIFLDNQGAQFWIHYFRCGIGLVNLSFFNHLAGAEGSLTSQTRNVTHVFEYQWFTHDLSAEVFGCEITRKKIKRLSDYFIEKINPTLVNSYSIYFEAPKIKEPYKFVSGSLERFEEVLTWTRSVCEGLKQEREPNGKTWVSPHVTINCGNLKDAPDFEHSTETFINATGALAVKENSSYTVLQREGFGRRAGGESYDWARKINTAFFFTSSRKIRKSLHAKKSPLAFIS
jgi:hypothetical protein